ncbi:hypothetical protein [Streptosporangium sp. KLBMP 9127]|nr:hypothetical protein [Streptosporangium sp. KLBMP 9127]
MFTTRSVRRHRPAGSFSGRMVANALIAVYLVVGLAFTHGGACAALIISEAAGHAGHTAQYAPTTTGSPGSGCSHDDLPSGHRHGAEHDTSTATVPGAEMPAAEPSATPVLSCLPTERNVRTSYDNSTFPNPRPPNLYVMRI